MNYVILAAGEGKRMHPFTRNYPKCLIYIGNGERVIQRMIRMIQTADPGANIFVVLGFRHHEIIPFTRGCKIVINPFYSVTNSIASLWFVQEALHDQVTIINGDIIVSDKLLKAVMRADSLPTIFFDRSIKVDGDYNVQVNGDHVSIMSKELDRYDGEYAGITKLDKQSAALLKNEICSLINNGAYNEWYENALVQMILSADFKLYHYDISDYEWHELDTVNDLLYAKELIHKESKESLP